MERCDKAVEEDTARAELVAWLETAPEREIARFMEAADRYRIALVQAGKESAERFLREQIAYGEATQKNEAGVVMKGVEGRVVGA